MLHGERGARSGRRLLMARSSCKCGYGKRKPLAATTFDETWKLFADEAPDWQVRGLAFGNERVVNGGGCAWRVSVSIEVGRGEVEARVLITQQKPQSVGAMTPSARLKAYGFLHDVSRQLGRAGYQGEVEDDMRAIYGGFYKTLADVDAVKREVRRLEGLRIGKT
jgi:hypothetical protein